MLYVGLRITLIDPSMLVLSECALDTEEVIQAAVTSLRSLEIGVASRRWVKVSVLIMFKISLKVGLY